MTFEEAGRPDLNSSVVEGADLNCSKSPFDKKEYRQILLPNGLRAVLISDTVAMTQSYNSGGIYMEDDDTDADTDADDADKMKGRNTRDKLQHDSDCDSDEEKSEDESIGDEDHGLRNAAAAMVVGVGSMADPPECQGMAHFLEHLLFMGSKKYPAENAYDAAITKYGGSNNAYTELEYTVYHFDVTQEYLAKALDMFAQFFIAPLMLESSVERELNSIESEFQLVKNNDGSRLQHLMSHTCGHTTSEHPFAKFSWGNLESLKETPKEYNIDPMVELRKFYDKHYYASNMRLVVVGGYPLDILQEHVLKSFSEVPSKGFVSSWNQKPESPFTKSGMPFTETSLKQVYYMAPVRDRHALNITWQIPSQFENWRSKPADYLAHLIGHEAKGSVLAALKAKSWATGCYAGVGAEGYEHASSHALFIVSFSLSEEGVMNWRSVISILYQYIGMLRYFCSVGLPTWIYEELRAIQEVSYRYGDEQSPEDLVESLADELAPSHHIPAERLLDGTSLLFEYDPQKIQEMVDTFFTPENARIDFSSTMFGRSADYEAVEANSTVTPVPHSDEMFNPTKGKPIPLKEPIFGTPYWVQNIQTEQIREWVLLSKPGLPPTDSLLELPPQNHFVPTNFALKELPPSDCHHPLLNSSIKVQIPVGKKKQWFAATVTSYDGTKNRILLSYEDEEQKWHKIDTSLDDINASDFLSNDFEGSLDAKKLKYRVVALAKEGTRAIRRFGDESDYEAEEGIGFPPIPPPPLPSHLPKLVCNTQMLKMWHLQDRTFNRPIAELRVLLHCADAYKTSLHAACADIFVHLISDSLTETAYLASVCELGSALAADDGGFSMRVHGFDNKLLDLFAVMFDTMMQFADGKVDCLPDTIKDGRFDLCLETYQRQCSNGGMKASRLASGIRIRCLRSTSWSSHQKLKAIQNLDIPIFMQTIQSILNRVGVEALFHGNVDLQDAKRAETEILDRLSNHKVSGLPRKKYPPQLVMRLPSSNHALKCLAKDPNDPNTAVEVYFQVGKDNIKDRVMVDLLMEMMYEPLYNQIRTVDQFGYQVSCDCRWTNGIIGIHFQVVSSSKCADEIDQRIETFITDYRETLQNMNAKDFMQFIVAVAHQKLDMFNSLSEETNHYWSEIRDGRYSWDVDRQEVLCLKSFTKTDALKAYDQWLSPASDNRRRLAVQVICNEGEASTGRPAVADDVDIGEYNDACVKEFHSKHCKNQTYGRVY